MTKSKSSTSQRGTRENRGFQTSLSQFSAKPVTVAPPATWKNVRKGMMSGAGGTVKASTSKKSWPLMRSQRRPSAWISGQVRCRMSLRSVVSMNAADSVTESDASGTRLMKLCVCSRSACPPIGSSATLALPPGASAPTQKVRPSSVEAIWPVAMPSDGSDVPSGSKTSVSRKVGPKSCSSCSTSPTWRSPSTSTRSNASPRNSRMTTPGWAHHGRAAVCWSSWWPDRSSPWRSALPAEGCRR